MKIGISSRNEENRHQILTYLNRLQKWVRCLRQRNIYAVPTYWMI